MNSKAALAMALLKGETISIKTGFKDLGITNVPREIGRSIERAFNVKVSSVRKLGKSRYGVPCTWFEYRLYHNDFNKAGIEKMKVYVRKHMETNPKTEAQEKRYQQMKLILK